MITTGLPKIIFEYIENLSAKLFEVSPEMAHKEVVKNRNLYSRPKPFFVSLTY